MKRFIRLFGVALIGLALTGCGKDVNAHIGEAKTPAESDEQQGNMYPDVEQIFREKGFTNIKTETIDDLITGWLTKDGEVEHVSVGGSIEYRANDWYPDDIEIIITYHTFPERNEGTSSDIDLQEDDNQQDLDSLNGAEVENGQEVTSDIEEVSEKLEPIVDIEKEDCPFPDTPYYFDYVTENFYSLETTPMNVTWTAGMQTFGNYDSLYDDLPMYGNTTGIVALKIILANTVGVQTTTEDLIDALVEPTEFDDMLIGNISIDTIAGQMDLYGVRYDRLPCTDLVELLDKGVVVLEVDTPNIGICTAVLTGYNDTDYEWIMYDSHMVGKYERGMLDDRVVGTDILFFEGGFNK